jgi:hypothetical protein
VTSIKSSCDLQHTPARKGQEFKRSSSFPRKNSVRPALTPTRSDARIHRLATTCTSNNCWKLSVGISSLNETGLALDQHESSSQLYLWARQPANCLCLAHLAGFSSIFFVAEQRGLVLVFCAILTRNAPTTFTCREGAALREPETARRHTFPFAVLFSFET